MVFISHASYLRMAAEEAFRGHRQGAPMEGAVLVLDGQMIGVGHRGQEHAALICLKDAGLLSHAEMERATIYLTHWPCSCCLDSLRSSGIRQLVVPAKGEAREVPGIEVLALELMDDGSEWRLRPGSEAP